MAVDMFLKLNGIKGESSDHKHKDEIQIESFSWGMNQTGSNAAGGGGGAGKVSVHDICITKLVDKSTPGLMMACCNGKHIPDGLITVRKAGEKPLEYLKIKLLDVLVSSVNNNGSSAGQADGIAENVALNFGKFHVEYLLQKPDGSGQPGGELGWDIKANQKM